MIDGVLAVSKIELNGNECKRVDSERVKVFRRRLQKKKKLLKDINLIYYIILNI